MAKDVLITPASGKIELKDDNVTNVYISEGNVGIGTTDPDSILHVQNGSAGTVDAYSNSTLVLEASTDNNFINMLSPDAKNQGILFGDATQNWNGQIQYNHNGNYMAFYTNQSEQIRITSGGNVGIGTDDPSDKLHVKSASNVIVDIEAGTESTNHYSMLRMTPTGTQNSYLRFGGNFYSQNLSGTDFLTINSDGEVGIGNNDPTSILHIKSSQAIIQLDGTGTGATDHAGLLLQNEGSNKWQVQNHASNDRFQIYNYSQSNTGLSILSGGNVGIGTDNPVKKLDVRGGIKLGNSGNGSIFSDGDIYFQHSGRQIFMYDGSGAYTLKIYNAGTETVRLSAGSDSYFTGGNVGIGTDDPDDLFHVKSSDGSIARLERSTVASYTFKIDNVVGASNNTNALQIMPNDSSTGYLFTAKNSSGTATNALAIDRDGKVGIGTTAPGSVFDIKQVSGIYASRVISSNNTNILHYVGESSTDSGYLGLMSGGVDKVFLGTNQNSWFNGGNVGIGTTTPDQILQVEGTEHTGASINTTGASHDVYLRFDQSGTQKGKIGWDQSDAALKIIGEDGAFSDNDLVIKEGNVGIGTNNPLGNLHTVVGSTLATSVKFTTSDYNEASNTGTGLNIRSSTSSGDGNIYVDASGAGETKGTNGHLILQSQSGGYVSIGHTSTSYPLQVLTNISGGTNPQIVARDLGTSDATVGFQIASANNWSIGVDNSDSDKFKIATGLDVGTTSRVTIDTGGNVGIGTASPDAPLDIENATGEHLRFTQTGSTAWSFTSRDDGSTTNDFLDIGNTDWGRILTLESDTGYVGVGNWGTAWVDPAAPLHVVGSWANGHGQVAIEGPVNGLVGTGLRSNGAYKAFMIFRDGTGGNKMELGTVGDHPLHLQTNGHNNRLTILGDGNVGIGTDAPGDKLEVVGNVTQRDGSPEYHFETTDASHHNWRIAVQEVVNKGFEIASGSADTDSSNDTWTNRLVIKADTGNVGIGIDSPSHALHVKKSSGNSIIASESGDNAGDLYLIGNRTSDNDTSNLTFYNSSEPIARIRAYRHGANDAGKLTFATQATGGNPVEHMTICPDGRVGIGTASPQSALHTVGSGSNNEAVTVADGSGYTAGHGPSLIFRRGTTGEKFAGIKGYFNETNQGNRANLGLFTRTSDAAGIEEKVTILHDGKVGIGESSPAEELHIKGASAGSGTSSVKLRIEQPASTIGSRVNLVSGVTSGTDPYFSIETRDGSDPWGITEKFRIDSGGNVGIGTDSPDTKLHINGGTGGQSTGLSFGDGDTGFYEHSDDSLWFFSAGVSRWKSDSVYLLSTTTGDKATIVNEVASGTNPVFTFYNDTDTGIGKYAADKLSLVAGGTNTVTVANGCVGIGTHSPDKPLHVCSAGHTQVTIESADGNNHYAMLNMKPKGNQHGYLNFWGEKFFIAKEGSVARLTICCTGEVGIGTNSPKSKLHVDGTAGVNPVIVVGSNTVNGYVLLGDHYGDNGSNPESIMTLGLQYSGAGALWGWGVKPKHDTDNTYLASHNGWSSTRSAIRMCGTGISFLGSCGASQPAVDTAITMNTLMHICETGNVGIGTVLPNTLLHLYKASGTNLVRTETAANSTTGFDIKKTGSTTQHWRIADGQTANGKLEFYDVTDSRSVMTFDGAGNVGIGTTSPQRQLHIHCSSSSWNQCASLRLSSENVTNFYGEVQFHRGTDSTDDMGLNLLVSNSGSENLTPKLHVNVDGNVGIGTTSPGAELEVNGEVLLPNNKGILFKDSSSSTLGIKSDTSDRLTFRSGGSWDRMVIDSGNVGIGTSSPAVKLDVNGCAFASKISINGAASGAGGCNYNFAFYNNSNSYFNGNVTVDALLQVTGGSNLCVASTGCLILDSGKVGIGTTSPDTLLKVYQAGTSGNSYFEGSVQIGGANASYGAILGYSALGSGRVNISNLNNAGGTASTIKLGFGAITSGAPANTVVEVNQSGNMLVTGDVTAYASSDCRLKNNLKIISCPIDKVKALSGYEFDWNTRDQDIYKGNDVGVIAQEVEKVLPQIVCTRDTGYKAIKYEKIVPLLIEATKEQQCTIEKQQRQIDNLTSQVELLLKRCS